MVINRLHAAQNLTDKRMQMNSGVHPALFGVMSSISA